MLKLVVNDLCSTPSLTGLCAGFECGKWRAEALAGYLIESLPDFCLKYSEYSSIDHTGAVAAIRKAAHTVYTTPKYSQRGEFGELLLHVVLKQVFNTMPAISKLYYKDAANDTVKGFDAVHAVAMNGDLQLWLGEAKFYADAQTAMRAVIDKLRKHTERDYLKAEFLAITNKIDQSWPHAERLKKLLHPNTSLDEIFDRTVFPALLTYDGAVTGKSTEFTKQYSIELSKEFRDIHARLRNTDLPNDIEIRLILVPLKTKQVLVKTLHEKLQAWQKI